MAVHQFLDLGDTAGGAEYAHLGGIGEICPDGLDAPVDIVIRLIDICLHDALLCQQITLVEFGLGLGLAEHRAEWAKADQDTDHANEGLHKEEDLPVSTC